MNRKKEGVGGVEERGDKEYMQEVGKERV